MDPSLINQIGFSRERMGQGSSAAQGQSPEEGKKIHEFLEGAVHSNAGRTVFFGIGTMQGVAPIMDGLLSAASLGSLFPRSGLGFGLPSPHQLFAGKSAGH